MTDKELREMGVEDAYVRKDILNALEKENAGGVAANSALRKAAEEAALKAGIEFYRPSPILCTDNGAMIACAAHYASKERRAGSNLNAFANVSIENIDGLFNKSAN